MQFLKKIIRTQIKLWMDENREFTLIDVLPREYYDEIHLPGALNACVYYIDFIKQVSKLAADKSKPIIVYCNGSTSLAAEVAGEKLMAAGYTDVYHYKGGTLDWRRAGHPVEGVAPNKPAEPRLENRVYDIVTDQSIVEWTGRNLAGTHHGTINILSGSISIHRGHPSKANFKVDMESITDLDIADASWNKILVKHLKSDDFFDAKKFPVSQFESTRFQPLSGAKTGSPNFEANGRLTIRGVTQEIVFPATVTLREDQAISAEAHFDIDRTRWNINYGSGKFFEKLGRHLVYDLISLQVRLVAN